MKKNNFIKLININSDIKEEIEITSSISIAPFSSELKNAILEHNNGFYFAKLKERTWSLCNISRIINEEKSWEILDELKQTINSGETLIPSSIIAFINKKEFERKHENSEIYNIFKNLDINQSKTTFIINPSDPREFIYSNYYFKIYDLKSVVEYSNLLNIALAFSSKRLDTNYRTSLMKDIGEVFSSSGLYELKLSNLEEFKNLYLKLIDKCNKDLSFKDEKLKTMIYMYLYSIRDFSDKKSLCFIHLMTIIEMLYLLENENTKSKKIKARIQQILNENFEDLYKIRNDLVHEGKLEKFTNEKLLKLAEIVRKSLLLYLDNPNEFSKENLKKIKEEVSV